MSQSGSIKVDFLAMSYIKIFLFVIFVYAGKYIYQYINANIPAIITLL